MKLGYVMLIGGVAGILAGIAVVLDGILWLFATMPGLAAPFFFVRLVIGGLILIASSILVRNGAKKIARARLERLKGVIAPKERAALEAEEKRELERKKADEARRWMKK